MTQQSKHVFTDRRKALVVAVLSRKIGYLKVADFPQASIFESLPVQSLNAHRIIRCKDELFLLKEGAVEIWQTHHDRLVKELTEGVIFGDMPLLGQTMLGTRAITGRAGATVAVMDVRAAKAWIESDPASIFVELGCRLARIEADHYRSLFQLAESKLAAVLLELAGDDQVIKGLSHSELAERIGVYRETVTITLNAMKLDKLIEIGRKRITILDKRALQELSEL
ncbi:MAG TPA: helix-turn-helix domain-containing protein [Blastocatellia bacterium]|jgi:CRP-like cAMP-binding protein